MRQKTFIGLFAAAALILGTPQIARADANYDLIQAGYNGVPAQITALVNRGANVNARDDYGYTALMWAAQQNHQLTCRTLLDHGADVNARDKQGRTALLIATVKGHAGIVQLLMAHHADPGLKANNGISALDYARIYRMSSLQKLMAPMPLVTSATPRPAPTAKGMTTRVPTPRPMATVRPVRIPTPAPRPMPTGRPSDFPRMVETARPAAGGNMELPTSARDTIGKLHGRFMEHLGLRDPEAIVQKGFNQDLEDKLDQAFLALDYGHTGTMARAKLMDARKLLNTAKQIASQPDPQDDKTCRQILGSLDELMTNLGF